MDGLGLASARPARGKVLKIDPALPVIPYPEELVDTSAPIPPAPPSIGTLVTLRAYEELLSAVRSNNGERPASTDALSIEPILIFRRPGVPGLFYEATGVAIVDGLAQTGPIAVKCYDSESAIKPLDPEYESDVFLDFVDDLITEPTLHVTNARLVLQSPVSCFAEA